MPAKGKKRRPLSYEAWVAKLRECATAGWYTVMKCTTCGAERYAVHHGCGLTTCPTCAEDYSRRMTARLLEAVRWLESRRRPGYAIRVITLTLRPSGNMQCDVKRLQRCIKLLWRRIGAADRGLVAALEVGRSCNVHAHCVYYGPYLSQKGLSDTWQDLTGDSHIVWIEAPRGKSLTKAVLEIGKYITKGLSDRQNQRYVYAIYCAFYGRRRVLEYGLLLGTMASEPPPRPCPICGCVEVEAGQVLSPAEYDAWKKTLDTG